MDPLILSIILGLLWSQVISHFGASILLHRHYCHRQFDVPKWFEVIGLYMLMVAVIRTPIGWISSHRMHHHHSDSEKDPHSAKYIGFWKVLFTTWSIPNIPTRYAKDLYSNKILVFFHKYWKHIWAANWAVSYVISPYFFIGFALIPFLFAKVGFGLLNTVGHKDVGGSNVPWLNLFIAGEGYHRNHHTDSKLIRLHKWDTGGWLAEKLFIKRNI